MRYNENKNQASYKSKGQNQGGIRVTTDHACFCFFLVKFVVVIFLACLFFFFSLYHIF